MKAELYRTVIIMTEADLPKEDDFYTTHNKVESEWIIGYTFFSKKEMKQEI